MVLLLLTRTVVDSEGHDRGCNFSTASLVGTVTKTVGEARVGAQAVGICAAATQIGSLTEHVVDTGLLCCELAHAMTTQHVLTESQ